ncbi:hypothetical protein JOC85_004113 [Bacillus mesophilus]|uniref:Uncharacterized protein n=1 Tax=Bacillus mesophilus TaxID=1808955 RepID=A0A6M0QDN4_9BACI|nr:hypothetical protein [Bacillus mesophilus]MBM7663242.1 hypothetical protein [Bacillus mesophilus]NEY73919.1 hypothetical protein [Bacillus mesophilus]
MFDPTIFDNLKVVIEGAIYDRDLEGELEVINRKDVVDLARMSRHYQVTFKLLNHTGTYCSWELSSSVSQLSNELLATPNISKRGCTTDITFFLDLQEVDLKLKDLQVLVSNVWGDREIKIRVISEFPKTTTNQVEMKLLFNRTIHEDDIDDLIHMFHHMEKTLHLLQANGY